MYYPMDVDDVPAARGSRPDRLSDVSGPQERVQRRTVEQIVDRRGLPPGQGGIEILAAAMLADVAVVDVPVNMQHSSSSLWCFLSSSTEWWLFQLLHRDRSA